MSGLLRRSGIRIISNYVRLITTFAVGLVVIRLLAEVGASTLNVYMLLLSGTGFAYFFMVVMQESVIPLLGLSYDNKTDRSFAHLYWISLLLAVIASVISVAIFSLIWAVSDKFDTGALPKSVLGIALVGGALRTVATSIAAPPLNAVLLSGGIVFYNAVQAAERVIDLIAVVIVLVFLSTANEIFRAEVFFLLSSVFYVLIQIGVFLYARRVDGRFGVRPMPVQRADLKWVSTIFGWNLALVVAFLLYLRLSTFVININYGEGATLILGIVFLLIGYQRQISMGLVIGLDAVIARIYGAASMALIQGPAKAAPVVTALILRTTYVQGLFSFASIAVLWLLADPIFRYWLGNSLNGNGWSVDQAVLLFRVMSVGSLARSISESWMKLLNGRGLVARFAPWVLAGGVIYAGLLIYWGKTGVPADTVLVRLVVSYSVLLVLVHLGCVSIALARAQAIGLAELLRAALAPGLCAALPFVLLGHFAVAASSLVFNAMLAAVVGLVSAVFLLNPRAMQLFVPRLGRVL